MRPAPLHNLTETEISDEELKLVVGGFTVPGVSNAGTSLSWGPVFTPNPTGNTYWAMNHSWLPYFW
jgi:hypothetical protein